MLFFIFECPYGLASSRGHSDTGLYRLQGPATFSTFHFFKRLSILKGERVIERALESDTGRLFSNVTQRKNKSKTNIIMLQEKNKEDTFPSVRSLHFPKLQIFVEMVCANLQVTKRTLNDPRRSGNVVLSLGSFSGQLLSHVYGPSYKRALPVSLQFKKTDLRVSTVSTHRHALTSVRSDVFILWKIV